MKSDNDLIHALHGSPLLSPASRVSSYHGTHRSATAWGNGTPAEDVKMVVVTSADGGGWMCWSNNRTRLAERTDSLGGLSQRDGWEDYTPARRDPGSGRGVQGLAGWKKGVTGCRRLPRNATTLLHNPSQHDTGPTKLRRLLTPLRIPHHEVHLRFSEHQGG
jgi:hypothetical protein